MRKAHRLALQRLVLGQVVQAQAPGVAGVLLHLVHHGLRHLTLVESRHALAGDALQQRGQGWVAQHVPDGMGLAIGLVKVGQGGGVKSQIGIGRELCMQARADGKPVGGPADRRFKQPRPGQASVLLMRQCQHVQHTGGAHGTSAHHRLVKRHGLTQCVEQQVFAGSGRRALASVKGLHPCALAVQQECPTAQAAGLRLDQSQDHLHGHGGVHRRATGLQHLEARLGGQGVGCGHRPALIHHLGVALQAGGHLGLHHVQLDRGGHRTPHQA